MNFKKFFDLKIELSKNAGLEAGGGGFKFKQTKKGQATRMLSSFDPCK